MEQKTTISRTCETCKHFRPCARYVEEDVPLDWCELHGKIIEEYERDEACEAWTRDLHAD